MPTLQASTLFGVFLDTGVLGSLTQRSGANANSDACSQWANDLQLANVALFVPEVADYELRREFLRTGNSGAIARLEKFSAAVPERYVPVTTSALREAARLWAALRNAGLPTASKDALDDDAIIVGQVIDWCIENGVALDSIAIVTTNVSDLSRFTDVLGNPVPSATWQEIVI